AVDAGFYVSGVAVDPTGVIYASDAYNCRLRRIDTAGIIQNIAGTGSQVYAGDAGPASSASLFQPVGMALDTAGDLFLVDGNEVRAINLAATSHVVAGVTIAAGNIDRIAGAAASGNAGNGGPARSAHFNFGYSSHLVAASGGLFVAD